MIRFHIPRFARTWVVAALATSLVGCTGDEAVDTRSGPPIESSVDGTVVLTVRRQEPTDHSVVIDSADLARAGYVGVYEEKDNAPGRLLSATKLLTPGRYDDLTVLLPKDYDEDHVFVVVHVEDNGTTTLDYPEADAPVAGEGGAAVIKLQLGG